MIQQVREAIQKVSAPRRKSPLKIFAILSQETAVSRQRIAVLAVVSGIANSLLLVIVNQAVIGLQNDIFNEQLVLQYLLAFMLFIFAQRTAQGEAIAAVEEALQRVRVRIADKVRRSELGTIEAAGDISHYASLNQGANMISQAAMYFVTGVEALIVLVFASLYLLWLSPPAYFVVMVLVSIAVPLLVSHYRKTFRELSEASRKEGLFFGLFSDLLQGFKQLKVNDEESDKVFSQIQQLATETAVLKRRSNLRLLEDTILADFFFYFLLFVVVFVLPVLVDVHSENLFQVIATILFMMEPASNVSSAIPNWSKTNVAITGLYNLEERLDRELEAVQQGPSDSLEKNRCADFAQISLTDCTFAYPNAQQQPPFTVGPCSMTFWRGETVFIVGANGSGKSTLLKLITGLYHSNAGAIHVDQYPLQASDYAHYRQLFSVVFDDFHLFSQLHGAEHIDETEVQYWLKKMQIDHVICYANGEFGYDGLSAGYRKRLAWTVAVLQQHPILVFDGLFSDQDSAFQQQLYQHILPELKQQGRTVVCVNHDDRYCAFADRVFFLEAGCLREYSIQ